MEKSELVIKYEQMFFLEKTKEENKQELSELFENFSKYLINIGEENLLWGKCDFAILFIPLIKKLYEEYGETDYKGVYVDFKKWYNREGVRWEGEIDNIDLLDYMGLYIQYYKSK